ncbi:nucleotidyltransferase family protein [Halochromatium roseum]|uniref:nucleotidyltransferase family protein n=1 Tax=Halochromatium roseum TaxID=391920 RepID=UPI0019121AB6|nr:nucleotidyltransferase domain-containing protein [Halochromatium roseum]MBK5940965.1 hypothetical protein [Halochromatium roseum]
MADPLIFGLSARIHSDFRDLFARYRTIDRVLIFGSRADGSAHGGSDIDLAVFAPEMTDQDFARLWNEVDDLPLVFKVDLLHWDRLANQRLKAKILRDGRAFFTRSGDQAGEIAA